MMSNYKTAIPERRRKPGKPGEPLTCLVKSSPFCSFPTRKQREKHLSINDSTGGSFPELATHITKKTWPWESKERRRKAQQWKDEGSCSI